MLILRVSFTKWRVPGTKLCNVLLCFLLFWVFFSWSAIFHLRIQRLKSYISVWFYFFNVEFDDTICCFNLAIDKYIYIFKHNFTKGVVVKWSKVLRTEPIHTTGEGSNPRRNRQDFWPVKMLQTIFFCVYIYFTLLFKSLILN